MKLNMTLAQNTRLRTDAEKALLFSLFLHVNRELNDFQREVLTLVLDHEKGTREDLSNAVLQINRQVELLGASGWTPDRKVGDQVLKPDHYDRLPMEPTYFIVTSGGFNWCVENFIKYITRYRFKNGLEDLKKAMRNLAMYIRLLDGDSKWSR
ncbi:DUF3310 domain-containing protein [Rhizobium sp. CECT 9324]|uniref:DUF3310 domain-containing protein n=1 Tax=Rhizobium sp. CECT 9324 TaxID=2845820 RepID=UPI001E6554EF|nr:DUF3310 domain-containing protein [Rhizobium sp. CECT 9324]CAH0343727.1 hypothetical protein RHI9324_05464 [Rhizobium sp. CECT 9324]